MAGSGHYVISWLPRYLVDVVYQDGGWLVQDSEARVAQLNLDGSLSHRVLVDFSGRLPSKMRSMDCLPQYRSIAGQGVEIRPDAGLQEPVTRNQ